MDSIKFEEALKKLEKIVEDLEGGELPLDGALKKYEEGVRLARECTKKLEQAEKKIEVLSKQLDGNFTLSEFDETDAEEETASKPKKIKKEKSA